MGWPFLAQRGGAKSTEALPWFGLHGWVYGSVAGALAVVTVPFCRWYIGPAWTVSQELLWVIVLRFLIVGLGSSATSDGVRSRGGGSVAGVAGGVEPPGIPPEL